MKKTTYKRISAVSTTAEVLRFLADQREPVTGQAVSQALGISYGKIMCHLATLDDEQYVRRVGECWELGQMPAYLWARYKSRLEGRIGAMTDELKSLEV